MPQALREELGVFCVKLGGVFGGLGARAPRTHQILLGKGIPIVEGLALGGVRAGDYDLIVLPIKVAGHEGAPARAILRKRAP